MNMVITRLEPGASLADFLAAAGGGCRPDAGVTASLLREDFAGCQEILVGNLGNRPAGRMVARCSPSLKDAGGRPLGMIGFFECANSQELASGMFAAARAWFAERGVRIVVGPMDGDTWHSYRFNTGPHDVPPFFMEPGNPAYYPGLWVQAGFAVAERYCSKVVEDPAAAARSTARIAERALSRGYRLRPLDRTRLAEELPALHALSLRIFARNAYYTDIPVSEFLSMYRGVETLLRDGLSWFAVDPRGADAGFVFAFPDPARPDTVNVKTLGVVPEHQRTGISMALIHRVYAEMPALGYARANLCLIRDGNASARMDGGLGRVFRRYALYQGRVAE